MPLAQDETPALSGWGCLLRGERFIFFFYRRTQETQESILLNSLHFASIASMQIDELKIFVDGTEKLNMMPLESFIF